MSTNLWQKSIALLWRRQTNIISAASVIIATVILSQVLGLVRQRLLVGIFGASNTLGVYFASSSLPNFLFQLVIVGALSSSFIPIFSDYLSKNKNEEAHKVGYTLLILGLGIFSIMAFILFIFAGYFSKLMAPGFSPSELSLMVSLTRIIICGELLFIIASFFSAILQSYNRFFITGLASALYNLGIIIGILFFYKTAGIFSAAYGVILGSFLFALVQIPLVKKVGFSLKPSFSLKAKGIMDVFKLMWPRTLAIGVSQIGTILTVTLISFLQSPGRSYVIFDYAQTLAYAPVTLFGQSIAQAAFPILSREKDNIEDFKATFITSFNQILYLVLPVSVLLLVLRIPIVRLIYGVGHFDWQATVLTGRTLAFFTVSIVAQSLIYLISRGFYALHDTRTPLVIGFISTVLLISFGAMAIFIFHFGVESMAIAYSLSSIINALLLFIFIYFKLKGLRLSALLPSVIKITLASIITAFALYIPIKLLDQLVFNTTHTINLIILTGISSFIGLSIYLFLTWLFNVKEALMFILLFKKIGNWREVLEKSDEVIDGTHFNT